MGLRKKIKSQFEDAEKYAKDNPPEVSVFDSAEPDRIAIFKRRMKMLASTRGGAGTLSGPLPGVSGDASALRGIGIA